MESALTILRNADLDVAKKNEVNYWTIMVPAPTIAGNYSWKAWVASYKVPWALLVGNFTTKLH